MGNTWAPALVRDSAEGIADFITLPFRITGSKNKWAFDEGTEVMKTGDILKKKPRRRFKTKAQAKANTL